MKLKDYGNEIYTDGYKKTEEYKERFNHVCKCSHIEKNHHLGGSECYVCNCKEYKEKNKDLKDVESD